MHLLRCYVTSSLGQVVEKEQELCLPQKKKKNVYKKRARTIYQEQKIWSQNITVKISSIVCRHQRKTIIPGHKLT